MEVKSLEVAPKKAGKSASFAGDTFKLVTGTAIAQVLAALAYPLLTRLYTPGDYGVAALFISIITIMETIACFRYELAIVLPEENDEAANVFGLSVLATLGTALLTIPVIVWGGEFFAIRLLKAPDLMKYLWWLPVGVLAVGLFSAQNYWNSRGYHFGRLAARRITQALVMVGVQLVAAYAGWLTPGSLILGTLAGYIVATLVLTVQIWRDDHALFKRAIHWQGIKQALVRYRRFPFYTIWASLLNSVSWQLPVFLLSTFFPPAIVGYYALGNRVLRIPMNLVGSAMSQTFFPRAAEALKRENLAILVENALRRLVTFSLFPLLILSLTGREIFAVFFGAQWAEAGIYTQILSLWMFFWFISAPLSNVYFVLEKQDLLLKLNITIFLTRLLSLLIGGYWRNPHLALALFAVSGVVTYGYLALAIVNLAQVAWRKILEILKTNVLYFVPVGVLLTALKGLPVSAWIIVMVAIVSITIYSVYNASNDQQIYTFLDARFGKVPGFRVVRVFKRRATNEKP